MQIKIDLSAFIGDYCKGVKDKDLAARHNITARELAAIVKKLLSNGAISREQYLERNRRIQQVDAHLESDFLKSLYHCPTCSHAQPIPFTVCPACGASVAPDPQPTATEISEGKMDGSASRAVETADELERMLGAKLKDFSIIPSNQNFNGADYVVTDIVGSDAAASVLKAAKSSGEGPFLSVRMYNADPSIEGGFSDFLDRVINYQSGMSDSNIVRLVGSATLDEKRVLLHEFMPTNLEALIRGMPDGAPLDLAIKLIPQILNAVAYTHLHRSKDGAVRKLPHMFLSASSFLFDADKGIVKLADCGVWRSKTEVRGHMERLWEEPAIGLAALAPEAFVMSSKTVKATAVDIYALGVVLYRLVTGKCPFSGNSLDEYSFLHLKTFAIPPRVHRYTIPAWLDSMILKCLEKEPGSRWRSATQMELSIGKGIVH